MTCPCLENWLTLKHKSCPKKVLRPRSEILSFPDECLFLCATNHLYSQPSYQTHDTISVQSKLFVLLTAVFCRISVAGMEVRFEHIQSAQTGLICIKTFRWKYTTLTVLRWLKMRLKYHCCQVCFVSGEMHLCRHTHTHTVNKWSATLTFLSNLYSLIHKFVSCHLRLFCCLPVAPPENPTWDVHVVAQIQFQSSSNEKYNSWNYIKNFSHVITFRAA